MISTRVDNTKRMATGSKVKIDLVNNRPGRILEINSDEAADRACSLIKKSSRLAEIFILGILGNLRNLDGRNLAVIIKMIKNRSDKHLISRR